jgi:CRISPR system Cascade subunit CasD
MRYLVFAVMAPLGSWGSPGSTATNAALKLTDLTPTRSAIVGLLAACLGMEREDQARLAGQIAIAVRTDVAPVRSPLLDYHTISRGKAPPHGGGSWTRFEEVREAASSTAHDGAILSRRESFSDGLWTIAVAAQLDEGGSDGDNSGAATLEAMAAALKAPFYVPYIGRRCYPLGLPPDPDVIDSDSLIGAMTAYGLPWARGGEADGATRKAEFGRRWLGKMIETWRRSGGRHQLAWDHDFPGAPETAVRTVERRDEPAHTRQPSGALVRSFSNRIEHQAVISWELEAICSAAV